MQSLSNHTRFYVKRGPPSKSYRLDDRTEQPNQIVVEQPPTSPSTRQTRKNYRPPYQRKQYFQRILKRSLVCDKQKEEVLEKPQINPLSFKLDYCYTSDTITPCLVLEEKQSIASTDDSIFGAQKQTDGCPIIKSSVNKNTLSDHDKKVIGMMIITNTPLIKAVSFLQKLRVNGIITASILNQHHIDLFDFGILDTPGMKDLAKMALSVDYTLIKFDIN